MFTMSGAEEQQPHQDDDDDDDPPINAHSIAHPPRVAYEQLPQGGGGVP